RCISTTASRPSALSSSARCRRFIRCHRFINCGASMQMMRFRYVPGLALAATCLLSDLGFAATWTASVDERNGLPHASRGGGAAVTTDLVFWGKDWDWAGLTTRFKIDAPFQYEVSGESPPLNLHLKARVEKSSPRQLSWTFDLDAARTLPDVIG